MKFPILFTTGLLAANIVATSAAFAENPYYGNDIDEAVRDAERNPANLNYVGNRWYNRSTSKSFDFPKLMNKEMDSELVKGALDSTAAGPGDEPPERENPVQLVDADIPAKEESAIELLEFTDYTDTPIFTSNLPAQEQELLPTTRYTREIQFKGNDFEGRATDIQSSSTATAYSRE